MSGSSDEKVRAGWSYSGEVWTDSGGRAVVVLPPFVRTHRAGFDYELTPIASASSATVAEEIADDRFTVATDEPHVKVAWRVTALEDKRSTGGEEVPK
jgi:hypothetical protein